ncbi:Carboxylesterase [Dipodascopsis uninucleata]
MNRISKVPSSLVSLFLWTLLLEQLYGVETAAIPYSYSCSRGKCIAQTTTGAYRGFDDPYGPRWLSIRYAKPPTEELRFADPVVFTPDNNIIYEADTLPPYCIQYEDNQSEDCLFLNVFRPPTNVLDSLPIMVWIHGGSFYSGGSADPVIYGSVLAYKQNLIVVSFNYRLGVFGFFDNGVNTNFAVKDVLMAIKWVYDNAHVFGGDKTKITVAGQSSGATMIRALISSQKSKNLFSRAIIQSDPMDFGFNTRNTSVDTLTNMLYHLTGCSDLVCMRDLSIEELVSAQTVVISDSHNQNAAVNFAFPFSPVIDNDILRADFAVLVSSGELPVQIPLIIGTVNNETNQIIEQQFPNQIAQSAYPSILKAFIGTTRTVLVLLSGIFTPHTSRNDAVRLMAALFSTMFYWRSANNELSVSYSKFTRKHVYSYLMTVGITYPDYQNYSLCSNGAVCHESDLYPLFGTYNVSTVSKGQVAVSQEMQQRWGAFIKTGDPNQGSYLKWLPIEDGSKMNALLLGSNTVTSSLDYKTSDQILGHIVKFDYQLYSK